MSVSSRNFKAVVLSSSLAVIAAGRLVYLTDSDRIDASSAASRLSIAAE